MKKKRVDFSKKKYEDKDSISRVQRAMPPEMNRRN